MGLFDSITAGQGSLAAGALGFLGGALTNQANQDVAAANNQWSAEQYAKRYQTQVADLKAAGLNPMLAYNQSPGTAPSAQQVVFQNPMSSAADAFRSATSGAQSVASAGQANAQVKQIEATVDKIKSEIKFIDTDEKRLHFVMENLYQQNNLLAQQGRNEVVREQILMQTITQLQQENLITSYDIKAMKDTNFVGRVAREMKPLADIGTDVMDSLKFWKGKTVKETGTTYDKRGRESGGYSRERYEK